MKFRCPKSRAAFTLVEMLAVLVVIGLLIGVTAPLVRSMAMGSTLTQAGQLLGDQFQFARQEAVGRNRDVQVRLIWLDTAPAGYRAIQFWAASESDSTKIVPISKIVYLPQGTLVSSSNTLSPLLANATMKDVPTTFPGLGTTKYTGYRFRASGETDLPFDSVDNFLTIVQTKDASTTTAPANFYIVQLDPINGRTRSFRP